MTLAAGWTFAVSLGLLGFVAATGITVGAVLLAMPFAAGAVALRWPASTSALGVAALLLGATATLLLLGGEGLLYVPPFLAMLAATARAGRSRATDPDTGDRPAGVR